MSELTYTTINKTTWGEGPWSDEPDKIQWTDEDTGLPCLVKRTPHAGHLCGYVGVPRGHRFYERDYGDVFINDDDDWETCRPPCHGELTYASHCQEGPEAETICHLPAPGESDDVWWLGFDCAHSGDLSPARAARYRDDPDHGFTFYGHYESYRDVRYVRWQCSKLAAWLAENS